MADKYVFADEAGNFDFNTKPGASRYFILTTVTMKECSIGDKLQALRQELGWKGHLLDKVFHASEDTVPVRKAVFEILSKADLRIDSTIYDKPKAQRHIRPDQDRFYKVAWFLHFKYVAERIVKENDRLFVAASSIQTKKKKCDVRHAIEDVVQQVAPCEYRVAYWDCDTHSCLQVADYCSWAIQRKWEKNDTHFYDMMKDKIKSEYDIWKVGQKVYY